MNAAATRRCDVRIGERVVRVIRLVGPRFAAVVVVTLLAGIVGATATAWSEWQTFGSSDGMADSWIYTMLQDSKGNLWFATAEGLSRCDGANWRTYTSADGFNARGIASIREDHSGNLWCGGWDNGLIRYDGETWRTYTRSDGLASNTVSAIVEDNSGNLWVGSSWNGLTRFDGVSFRTYTTADGLVGNNIISALADNNGNLWFGTWDGVSRYDGVSWQTYTMDDGLLSNYVMAIYEDRSGNLWFGTDFGVTRYDGVSWQAYPMGNWVAAIFEDRSGNLWFATDVGVSRFDGSTWRTYTTADGLAYNEVSTILQDTCGAIWFATQAGASRYDCSSLRTYTYPDGPLGSPIWSIFRDRDSSLWFGSSLGIISRFDGVSWRLFNEVANYEYGDVHAIGQDGSGNMWFGTDAGVEKYDGNSWNMYTIANGLAGNHVYSVFRDRNGSVWFGTDAGVTRVTRFGGWRTFRTTDGLVGGSVRSIGEDLAGNVWFGTADSGACRYDGTNWRTYTAADGLAGNTVWDIEGDSQGNVWFGTWAGVSRYDGVSWRTYTVADGLSGNGVYSIVEDSLGNLWFGTSGGLTRYDGENFGVCTVQDGMPAGYVRAIEEDGKGNIWFSAGEAVVCHEPDLVAPQAVIWSPPPRVSVSPVQTIGFAVGFREVKWTELSYSFDESSWSDWSTTNLWVGRDLVDGQHVFRVRARDKIGNVDPTPAVCEFEIDATSPAPFITLPASGEAVRDSIVIRGTAADSRFKSYRVELRPLGATTWDCLFESTSPVEEGVLCGWNTAGLQDGGYELRLAVTDTLGLTGVALVRVTVDNHEPWAYETAPAAVTAATGGHIYTTNGEAHLYFPPHAFARDAEVEISPLGDADVPDTLVGGARRVLAGYEISWGSSTLEKPATLELSLAGSASESERLALYFVGAGSSWQRLGGTVDASGQRISLLLTEPGKYAVYAEGVDESGEGTLTAISLTPRVFSPGGSFANSETAVSFVLGRSGAVTVRVYNRAGRLVREVMSGEHLDAGTNLVRWDGRDGSGAVVGEGLYLVSVEALGQKQVKTVSVVK